MKQLIILNNIIDVNFYPTIKTQRSNFKHRPIGIGIQGLADVFLKMDLAFTSHDAKEINKLIFETIYFAALTRSYEISKERLEDLMFLKTEYESNNWRFVDSNPECREYSIYNVSDASSTNAKNSDTKIQYCLDKMKPVKAEIENLKKDFLEYELQHL